MSDWPHANTDFVLDKAVEWVDRFGKWPYWLAHSSEVATDLIRIGRKTRGELKAAGYRSNMGGRE